MNVVGKVLSEVKAWMVYWAYRAVAKAQSFWDEVGELSKFSFWLHVVVFIVAFFLVVATRNPEMVFWASFWIALWVSFVITIICFIAYSVGILAILHSAAGHLQGWTAFWYLVGGAFSGVIIAGWKIGAWAFGNPHVWPNVVLEFPAWCIGIALVVGIVAYLFGKVFDI